MKILLSLLLVIPFVIFILIDKKKLPLGNNIILKHEKGIYYEEYHLLLNESEEDFRLKLKLASTSYRLTKNLGRWILQVNKKSKKKIQYIGGQMGFYRFFDTHGKIFLIDALQNSYILNKGPDIFIDQINKNLENVHITKISKKDQCIDILKEIHKRTHQIIGCSRNISEYTKFNQMNFHMYVSQDYLISSDKITEICKYGPDVGIFLILWGDDSLNLSNLFGNIFVFKGKSKFQTSILHHNECLYIKNSLERRLVLTEKI